MTSTEGHIYNIQNRITKIVDRTTCNILTKFQKTQHLDDMIRSSIIAKYSKDLIDYTNQRYTAYMNPESYKQQIYEAIQDAVKEHVDDIISLNQQDEETRVAATTNKQQNSSGGRRRTRKLQRSHAPNLLPIG